MTTDTSTPDRRSFLDRQRDAALAEMAEQQAERSRIAALVLGASRGRRHVADLVKLGDDYLVEVTNGDDTKWTTVVNGKDSIWYHPRQEDAILYLIARRYDDSDNASQAAAFYAGRVLGVPAN